MSPVKRLLEHYASDSKAKTIYENQELPLATSFFLFILLEHQKHFKCQQDNFENEEEKGPLKKKKLYKFDFFSCVPLILLFMRNKIEFLEVLFIQKKMWT